MDEKESNIEKMAYLALLVHAMIRDMSGSDIKTEKEMLKIFKKGMTIACSKEWQTRQGVK